MFTGLMKYRNKSFWEGHKTITFDTLTDRHQYEAVSYTHLRQDTVGYAFPWGIGKYHLAEHLELYRQNEDMVCLLYTSLQQGLKSSTWRVLLLLLLPMNWICSHSERKDVYKRQV